jgi:hypothetical protein
MSYLVTIVGFIGADPEPRQARNSVQNSPFFPSPRNALGERAGGVVLENRVAPHLRYMELGVKSI